MKAARFGLMKRLEEEIPLLETEEGEFLLLRNMAEQIAHASKLCLDCLWPVAECACGRTDA